MEPLSYIYHREVSLKKEKMSVMVLIVVFVFDFFLFPAPILAAKEDAASTTDPLKQNLYLVEDTDSGLFFTAPDSDIVPEMGIIASETEKETIIPDTKQTDGNTNHLPVNQERKVVKTGLHPITAYNSEVAQCDASPCTTATGFNVCEHGIEDTIAANFLSFGTKVRIPDLFGDRIFIVRDRMNSRYTDHIDVWMKKKDDAKQFGVRIARIEIVD